MAKSLSIKQSLQISDAIEQLSLTVPAGTIASTITNLFEILCTESDSMKESILELCPELLIVKDFFKRIEQITKEVNH